jgi:trehalose 6-phosphate synthase
LGADLIGFHTADGVRNFRWLAQRLAGGRLTGSSSGPGRAGGLTFDGRSVKVGAFPISIDSAHLDRLARSAPVRERAAEIRRELGNPKRVILCRSESHRCSSGNVAVLVDHSAEDGRASQLVGLDVVNGSRLSVVTVGGSWVRAWWGR